MVSTQEKSSTKYESILTYIRAQFSMNFLRFVSLIMSAQLIQNGPTPSPSIAIIRGRFHVETTPTAPGSIIILGLAPIDTQDVAVATRAVIETRLVVRGVEAGQGEAVDAGVLLRRGDVLVGGEEEDHLAFLVLNGNNVQETPKGRT